MGKRRRRDDAGDGVRRPPPAPLDAEAAEDLARVADLHFNGGLSQKELAASLSVSESTVSRSLRQAIELKVVRFVIDHPRRPELERQLAGPFARFGVRDVIVS